MKIALVAAVAFLASHSEAFAPASFGVKRSTATTLRVSVDPNPPAFTVKTPETTVASSPKVAQRWRKSTKQLVTLGPASSNKEVSERLCVKCSFVFLDPFVSCVSFFMSPDD